MPVRTLSRVGELQPYPPNALQAVVTPDSEIVGPRFKTSNTYLYECR